MAFDLERFPTSKTALRMMSRVSPIYDRAYIAKWIYQAMGLELDNACAYIEGLREQAFPETATWGLQYWENLYGLTTDETLDIEIRRTEVLSRHRARIPMNPAKLEQILSLMTGYAVTVTEDAAPYTFLVTLDSGGRQIETIPVNAISFALRVKPSHLAMRFCETTRRTFHAETRLSVSNGLYSRTHIKSRRVE